MPRLKGCAFTGGGHPCEVYWKCSESQINCYVTYIYLSVYSHLSHKPKNENLVKKKYVKMNARPRIIIAVGWGGLRMRVIFPK